MNVIKRKVFKYGNSLCVTLPSDILKEKGLSKHKYVYFKLLSASDIDRLEVLVNERF